MIYSYLQTIFSSFLLDILMIQELLQAFQNIRSNRYPISETFPKK